MDSDRAPSAVDGRADGIGRRTLLRGAAALGGLAMMQSMGVACSPGPTASSTAVSAASPVVGGTLTVATTGDVTNFDLFVAGFNNRPLSRMYNTLLRYGDDLRPQPELATSWVMSSDGLTLTLKLRGGVKFHNGRALAAKDVVENLLRAMNAKTGGSMVNWASAIRQVDVSDDQTVVVRYEDVTADWAELLTRMPVIAPESFDKLKNSGIGTGPFQFSEWAPGEHVLLERFRDYWAPGLPRLNGVKVKPYADSEALASALEAGTVQAAIGFGYPYYDRLRAKVSVYQSRAPSPAVYVLLVNPKVGPLARKEARQALQFSIDREALVKEALFGRGEAVTVPYDKQSFAYDAGLSTRYSFDPSKAVKLLADAGLDKALRFSVMIPTTFPELIAMGQVMQADLKKIGVQIDIEQLEIAQYTPRLLAGKYDASLGSVGLFNTDPGGLTANSALRLINNPLYPAGDLPSGYVEGINNGRGTLDIAKRRAAYRKVQEALLDESWVIFLSRRNTLFAASNNVREFSLGFDDQVFFDQAWIAT